MHKTASDLRPFEIAEGIAFEDTAGGLVLLNIDTPLVRAQVYLHGAHVARFAPAGAEPVLFLSRESHYAAGKAIRGGVPICFPWFGPRGGRPDFPMHGFARTLEWELESLRRDSDGVVALALKLVSSNETRALWPHDFLVRHRIAIGAELNMVLEVQNPSSEPFTFEAALHTYLAVSDIRAASVTGLENARYLDKPDGGKTKTLGPEPLRFDAETDRVFPDHRATCVLDDPGLRRKIIIEKCASDTTVVWNPWQAKAAAMADFGDDEWPRMLCIETANAGENAVTLEPGQQHWMQAIVELH